MPDDMPPPPPRERQRRAWSSPEDIDVFAIVDGEGEIYWIPIEHVDGKANLSLRRYAAFRVPHLRREAPLREPTPDVSTID